MSWRRFCVLLSSLAAYEESAFWKVHRSKGPGGKPKYNKGQRKALASTPDEIRAAIRALRG